MGHVLLVGHLLDVDGLGRALAVLVARAPLLRGHLAFKANLEVDKSYAQIIHHIRGDYFNSPTPNLSRVSSSFRRAIYGGPD